MDASQLRAVMDALDSNPSALAASLDLSPETIRNLLRGKYEVPRRTELAIIGLLAIGDGYDWTSAAPIKAMKERVARL